MNYLGSWPILGGLGLFRLSSWSAESCSGLAAVEGGECPPPLVEPEQQEQQVWSLTQFYSVDFSQSWIGVNKCISTNAQSRLASVVVDGVLGPPRLALHT